MTKAITKATKVAKKAADFDIEVIIQNNEVEIGGITITTENIEVVEIVPAGADEIVAMITAEGKANVETHGSIHHRVKRVENQMTRVEMEKEVGQNLKILFKNQRGLR